MIWGTRLSASVGPLCFMKSKAKAAVYKKILKHFLFTFADKIYRDNDFLFQQNLAPAHGVKTISNRFVDHDITVLDQLVYLPDLDPIENLYDIIKRKIRDIRSNMN